MIEDVFIINSGKNFYDIGVLKTNGEETQMKARVKDLEHLVSEYPAIIRNMRVEEFIKVLMNNGIDSFILKE